MRTFALALILSATPALASTWKAEGPYFGTVTSMAIDPANPDRLWASTHGGGVWRSTDGGKTWQLAGKELSDRVVTYVVLQPKRGVLWAGVDGGGLARSTNGGDTWSWVHTDLADSPFPPSFDHAGGIWIADVNLHKRSADGAKWTEFRVSGGDVRTFAFHPRDARTIFAGGVNRRAGLWKSSDGGASWTQLGLGLPEMNTVQRLLIDPANPDTMYMVIRRGAFKSTDGGEHWRPIGGPIQDAEIESLTMHPVSSQTLFAGTAKGFFKTADGGTTWTRAGNGLPAYIVEALAIHPNAADVMWAGTSGGGIFKSVDGGRSWTGANHGFAASWIRHVWGDGADTIFVQTSGGLFRASRGAWTEVLQPFSDNDARADVIIFDAKTPNVVHAGWASRYYRSNDRGVTWIEVVKPFQDPSPEFGALAVDPKNPKILYSADSHASSGDPIIFKSTDGGVKWKAASRGVTGEGVQTLCADSAGTLLALGTESGLWRSTDGATSWSTAGGGLPAADLKALAVDPMNPSRVYVAAKDGFYRSEDGGSTFSAQKVDEPEAVAVDARGNVFLANAKGVSRSRDGGKTWTEFNDGLTNLDVRALSVSGRRLYAGTAGGGVFWIDID